MGPIQAQFAELLSDFRDVPNVQTARVNTNNQMPSICAESEWKHSGRKRKQGLQRASVIEAGAGEIIFDEPAGAGIRGKENACEVGDHSSALPVGGAPEFHLAKGSDGYLVAKRREFEAANARGVGELGDGFQLRELIDIEESRKGLIDAEPPSV